MSTSPDHKCFSEIIFDILLIFIFVLCTFVDSNVSYSKTNMMSFVQESRISRLGRK